MVQGIKEVGINYEGKINLRELLNNFLEKKFLIAGLTIFISAIVMIFLLNLPAKNQSINSFTLPSDASISTINKLNISTEIKASFFSKFLKLLLSKDFQRQVFIEGDFLTKLNKDNNSNFKNDEFTIQAINSIRISGPVLINNRDHYSLIIEEGNEAISEYLNTLLLKVNSKIISDLTSLNKLNNFNKLEELEIERSSLLFLAKEKRLATIKRIKESDLQQIRRINNQIQYLKISTQQDQKNKIERILNKNREINIKIVSLRNEAKEARLDQIAVLNESLVLAKSLGIIDNNFNNQTDHNLPEWYLFGEKALAQKIKLLTNRTSDDPFIPELADLKRQIKEIQENQTIKPLEVSKDDIIFIPQLANLKRQIKEIQENPTIKTLEARKDDGPFIDKDELIILDNKKREILMSKDINNFNVMQLTKTSTSSYEYIAINKWLISILVPISIFIIVSIMTLLMGLLKLDETTPA